MKGRLIDFSYSSNRRQRITIELDVDWREGYESLRESDIEVSVKKWRQKRSLDANAYMWVLIDKLAVATGYKQRDIYFASLRNVGGNIRHYCGRPDAIDALCRLWEQQGSTGWGWPYDRYPSRLEGCENIKLYYGSSTFDTATMARLIDHLIQDCEALDIETMPPEQLAALFEAETKS
jgi:hypothetical protein